MTTQTAEWANGREPYDMSGLTTGQKAKVHEILDDRSLSSVERGKHVRSAVKYYDDFNQQAAALPKCLVDAVEQVTGRPDFDSNPDAAMRELTLEILRHVVGWQEGGFGENCLARLSEYLEKYIGRFATRKDFGEEMGEEEYPHAGQCECCPSNVSFYIDWDIWARDQEWNGRWSPIEVRGWQYWFWNN